MSKPLLLFCIGGVLSCSDDSSAPPATSTGSAMPSVPDAGASAPAPVPEPARSTPPPAAGADASRGEASEDSADAGSDASSDAEPVEVCPPPGELDCSTAPGCCQGSVCVNDGDCATGCCLPALAGGGVCAASDLCDAPAIIGCTEVILRAADGTFLGDATSFLTPDSVCNPAGAYGSAASPTSIFNPFGTYGNTFGALSAYTPSTLTPPVLFCTTTEASLNPVSKNATLVGAIDPDVLCAALADNGI